MARNSLFTQALLLLAIAVALLSLIASGQQCSSEPPPDESKMAAPAASTHLQLMIPGPIEFSEDVLAAAGGLSVSHMDPTFVVEFGEALDMLRQVFYTERGQPFIVSGSGTLGWDMVASNLAEPGDSVLVLNTGYFGDRFGDSFEAFGVKVMHVRAVLGDRPSLAEIEAALAAAPPGGYKLITITQVDTSSGVLMDVKSISQLVQRVAPNTLVVVDGVCSVGAEELKVDEWGVGAVLTASQKALGTPPGLCILLISDKAIKALEARTTPIYNYYGSLKRWLPIMRAYGERRAQYFATPAVQLVQALRVSLKQMLTQTPNLDDRFAKHVTVSNQIKDEVESWGLRLLPISREAASHAMTAIRMPKGMAAAQLLPKIVARGVMVAGGLFPDVPYFRIGHMGSVTVMDETSGHIKNVLKVLREALVEAGHQFPVGATV